MAGGSSALFLSSFSLLILGVASTGITLRAGSATTGRLLPLANAVKGWPDRRDQADSQSMVGTRESYTAAYHDIVCMSASIHACLVMADLSRQRE